MRRALTDLVYTLGWLYLRARRWVIKQLSR